jgi:glyoxylase-like metal-dependent hydrolase (beta-lactamase superfamily II)
VRELRPGLWHWESPHPDWTPDEPWGREVSSYALGDGDGALLFDPLGVPGELTERATAIVLTAPWHERDTRSLMQRPGLRVFAPPPDTADDLMQKYGITAEQAGSGSPDLDWLLARDDVETHLFSVGDRLPFGAEVLPGREHNDVVLWLEEQRAVIAGDSLVDFGRGLEIPVEWLREGVTREQVADGLRPLLEKPVELVLPAHGAPTDRAALERALSGRPRADR